jgi:UDP-N-acetylglucosamine 2-epimerase (non-hydrolysing)/GDP/UDP-N,N'-diacetylbacillosamine 2-epimerase (hydrolysing)
LTRIVPSLIERGARGRKAGVVRVDVAPTVIPDVRGLRKVCFVSGTRAEFGLMRSTLEAIQAQAGLGLQIVCTGMHLDPAHGRSIDTVRAEGWTVDAEVKWGGEGAGGTVGGSPGANAVATGRAVAEMARVFEELGSDVVLVVGDRVEAFAAAAAGHISHRVVAHVHGGDRALGQVDDSLRHAISKLAHLHFPATEQSARRLRRMGEEGWRVVCAGSPGVDQIRSAGAKWADVGAHCPGIRPGRYALLVLHPTDADAGVERDRAEMVVGALGDVGFERVVVVYPNNDPGSAGIMHCWAALRGDGRFVVRRDVPRALFLGLMRDAAVLVGNSSSGIIEAASFGTPVVDVGPRQAGRERSGNVTNVPFDRAAIREALSAVWNGGSPRRSRARNVYGGGGAGRRIAEVVARVDVNDRLLRKLIAY